MSFQKGYAGKPAPIREFEPLRKLLVFSIIFVLIILRIQAADTDGEPLYMWYTSLGDSRMYLLGSIHVLSEDFYPLPEYINDVASDADVLVLEADITGESRNSEELSRLVYLKGFYQDGSNIKDHLNEPLYRNLKAEMERLDLEDEGLLRMKPWLLALTIQSMELEASGYRADLGMDRVISEKYFQGEIVELEGAVFQLELLSSLSDGEQLEFLESALDKPAESEESLQRLIRAWKTGNPDTVLSEMDREGFGGSIAEKLLYQRNVRMAEKAGNLLRSSGEGKTFLLIVGAAHFAGERGIPALLSAQGFTVSQVTGQGELVPFSGAAEF